MDITISTLVLGVVSTAIAMLAFAVVLWQAHLSRMSNYLQAMIAIQSAADALNYNQSIDLISRMESRDQVAFEGEFTAEQRDQINRCIQFLNFCAHLVESGLLKRQQVWNIYFISYRIVGKNLRPWWFDEQAKNYANRFSAANRMCGSVLQISDAAISAFDKRRA